jgi:glyceraldehyde 3-phosphate dehydrogenase
VFFDSDLTVISLKKNSYQRNHVMKAVSVELKRNFKYTDEPIVSIDIVGNPHSCIFDSGLTAKCQFMVKVVGWYDNEFGYSKPFADLTKNRLI